MMYVRFIKLVSWLVTRDYAFFAIFSPSKTLVGTVSVIDGLKHSVFTKAIVALDGQCVVVGA